VHVAAAVNFLTFVSVLVVRPWVAAAVAATYPFTVLFCIHFIPTTLSFIFVAEHMEEVWAAAAAAAAAPAAFPTVITSVYVPATASFLTFLSVRVRKL
jgi:hypothetical protein